MNERRKEQRFMCAELVELAWEDSFGTQHRALANLEDICLSGLSLEVDTLISPTTRVRVHYKGGELSGSVRHCQFRDIGYFLGVELDENSKWSVDNFRPQHLLDPGKLNSNDLTGSARPLN